jgi:hypothetical protein
MWLTDRRSCSQRHQHISHESILLFKCTAAEPAKIRSTARVLVKCAQKPRMAIDASFACHCASGTRTRNLLRGFSQVGDIWLWQRAKVIACLERSAFAATWKWRRDMNARTKPVQRVKTQKTQKRRPCSSCARVASVSVTVAKNVRHRTGPITMLCAIR